MSLQFLIRLVEVDVLLGDPVDEFTHFFVFRQLFYPMEFIPEFFFRENGVDLLVTNVVDQDRIGMLPASGFWDEVVFRNALAIPERSLANKAVLVVH